jgi:PAS domain S-box-containing protein
MVCLPIKPLGSRYLQSIFYLANGIGSAASKVAKPLTMSTPIRLLHLEDDPGYIELVHSLLESEGLAFDIHVVKTVAEFKDAAREGGYDLILADYMLPDSTGLDALRFIRERDLDTPFVLVSGTIREQSAIDSLRSGATDYVLKQWPERLVPAVCRALQEAGDRKKRKAAEAELRRREIYFHALTENSLDIVSVLDREARILYSSPSTQRVLGYTPQELEGRDAWSNVHADDLASVQQAFRRALANPDEAITIQFRALHRGGEWRYLEAVGQNRLADPLVSAIVLNLRDITDRHRTEENLRQNEKQYRLIFDGNPTPMWVFDHETLAFLEVNDAAVAHYGYSREEFLNMVVGDLRPDAEAAMIEYWHRLFHDQPPAKMGCAGVWKHRKKDGVLIDVEIKWCPISFQGRGASLSMVNDITERLRADHRGQALSALGQRLSSATTPTEAAQIIKSVADDLFQWDAFLLNLYSAEENLVTPILNIDTDRDGRRFTAELREPDAPSQRTQRVVQNGAALILRDDQAPVAELARRVGDTSRLSASLMYVPIRNRTRVIGVLSIQSYTLNAYSQASLMTLQTLADHCGGALERIRAEQALHRSEMLFQSVWENSVDGLRLTDEFGTIVAVNAAYCRLVGLSRGELEGKPFCAVYGAAEKPEQLLLRYREDFRNGTPDRHRERQWTLHNGQTVTLEYAASLVSPSGRSPLLFTLFRDVTNQRRLEEQFRQSQKMEAIGQLAGGVAHDFNNILTVIHGHASLLLAGGSLGPLPTRSAQQIGQAAERAASLTRQLLAFGRRQVLQPRLVDLNEIVANISKMLGRLLGEDVALQLNYSASPAMLHADPGMVEQILLNLAVNSRDAMPRGGVLNLRISDVTIGEAGLARHPEGAPGRYVCLAAIDTGCGIPAENLPRIFEPFFTTKEVGRGTGLGLATVYGIVRQHHGWIEVESEINRGTTFRVYFPMCEQAIEVPAENVAPVSLRGGTETILVVEDEAPVRELVCALLEHHGYRILQAESGVKALEIWENQKHSVDLVLTDLVMPDRINGRELAERLWSERPGLKVIFTSGYSADVVGKDFVLRKGLNYLQKPYQPQRLAGAVRDCLDALN